MVIKYIFDIYIYIYIIGSTKSPTMPSIPVVIALIYNNNVSEQRQCVSGLGLGLSEGQGYGYG